MKLSKSLKAQLKDSSLHKSNFDGLLVLLETEFAEISQKDLIRHKYCVAEPLCRILYILGEILINFDNSYPEAFLKIKRFDWEGCLVVAKRIQSHKYRLSYLEAYSIAKKFIDEYLPPLKKIIKKVKNNGTRLVRG